MAQDRSTKIISMIKRIRTSRLSAKNSLSLERGGAGPVEKVHEAEEESDYEDQRHQQRHLRVLRLGFRV